MIEDIDLFEKLGSHSLVTSLLSCVYHATRSLGFTLSAVNVEHIRSRVSY